MPRSYLCDTGVSSWSEMEILTRASSGTSVISKPRNLVPSYRSSVSALYLSVPGKGRGRYYAHRLVYRTLSPGLESRIVRLRTEALIVGLVLCYYEFP